MIFITVRSTFAATSVILSLYFILKFKAQQFYSIRVQSLEKHEWYGDVMSVCIPETFIAHRKFPTVIGTRLFSTAEPYRVRPVLADSKKLKRIVIDSLTHFTGMFQLL